MAAELLAGAAIGAGLGDALSKLTSAIIYVTKKTYQFRSELTQLQETITRNKRIFDEIEKLVEELGRPLEEKEMFIAQLKGAEALVLKCEHIKWNLHKRFSHSLKLKDLNASLLRFCQIDVQLMITRGVLDLQKRTMKVGPVVKNGVIGFEDHVRDLKSMVFKESGDKCSVVVVWGEGGCGKTTLVRKLCQDPYIQETFGKNIYFATVSRTPNLKMIIKSLLQQKRDFINDDDAINQWRRFLSEKESQILLVLDDAWSDSIVKLFMFKSRGYKILVTSRTFFTQFNTYRLPLLNHQDATLLFRYHAFSSGGSEHTNIPDDLVDKLVTYWGNLPLALVVLGSSLKGKNITFWLDMLKKLQQPRLHVEETIERSLARSLDV